MAATPRKFQEKIALINERAAQGTAAYEEIMQEVSYLRTQPRVITQQQPKSVTTQTQLPSRTAYSGSLPDFSINLSQNRPPGFFHSYSSQGAVSDLINLTQMYSSSGGGSVEPTSILGSSRPHPSLQTSVAHAAATHRHIHLSPPDMLSRSSSDSSLHQTAYQNKIIGSYRKGFLTEGDRHGQLGGMNYQLHKSSGDPFPSSDPPLYSHHGRSSAKPIPTSVGNPCGAGPGAGPGGGGSLPDLTHVQFIQPMPSPLRDLDAINQAHSLVSHRLESFPRMNGPYTGRVPSSRGTSPAMDRKQKTKPYSQPPSLTNQRLSSSNKNHLAVPSVINAHQHMAKAIVTDNSVNPSVESHIPSSTALTIFGRPLSPAGSHPTSPMPLPPMDYRNPASPQISPCPSPVPSLMTPQTGTMTQYRCSSPDSRGSAPPSPVSLQQSSSPASSPGATLAKPFVYEPFAGQTQTTNQLNHQFQQITVQPSHSEQLEPCSESGGSSASPSPSSAPSILSNLPPITSQIYHQTLPSSPSHIPGSPSHPSSPTHSPVSPGGVPTPLSQPPATPQTPLTPNVPLPQLVITDLDGNDNRDLFNENQELTSFIFGDDYILQSLNSLGDEMSVEQILVDNETEESFRRDLRNETMHQEQMPLEEMADQFLQDAQPQSQSQASTGCQTMPMLHSPSISIPNSLHHIPLQLQHVTLPHLQQQQSASTLQQKQLQHAHLQQEQSQNSSIQQSQPQAQLRQLQQQIQTRQQIEQTQQQIQHQTRQQIQQAQQQTQQQIHQQAQQQIQQQTQQQIQQQTQQQIQQQTQQQIQQQAQQQIQQQAQQQIQQQAQQQIQQQAQQQIQQQAQQQIQQQTQQQIQQQTQQQIQQQTQQQIQQQSPQQIQQQPQNVQQQTQQQQIQRKQIQTSHQRQQTQAQQQHEEKQKHQMPLQSPTVSPQMAIQTQSNDSEMSLNISSPILAPLEPLVDMPDPLLTYTQLPQTLPSSPDFSLSNQVELELHSTVCPSHSITTANSPNISWQQISEPNPQL